MSITREQQVDSIEFWFDPVCPWAWLTSRWLVEVSDVLGHEVTWKVCSLAILNESNDSGAHRESHERGLRYGHALVLVEQEHGNEAVARLYTELGLRIHHESRTDGELFREALEAAGLSSAFAQLSPKDAEEADALLRQSTEAGITAVGPGVGVPIVAINGEAFFGPVVSPRPKGEDALKLWNAVYFSTQTPGFFELKRGREIGPDFS